MLNEFWTKHFAGIQPITHTLRTLLPERWIRFHSLPNAKRYAETEDEWGLLLGRHNSIFSQLTEIDTQLELVTTNWSELHLADFPAEEIRELGLPFEHWQTIAMHEIDAETDPNYWHLYASTIKWVPGSIDSVIRLVADGCISNVMVLDPGGNWLIHPYDGGLDVILGSSEERDALSSEFASWRSHRSDGL